MSDGIPKPTRFNDNDQHTTSFKIVSSIQLQSFAITNQPYNPEAHGAVQL
jgi:hypothetical protein